MNMASLIPRQIEARLLEALRDTPVVLLAGPRQAGKTTLVKQIAERQGLRYFDLPPPCRTKVMEQSPLISENSGIETIQIYR